MISREALGHVSDPFSPSSPPAYEDKNKIFSAGVLSNDDQAHPGLVCMSPVGCCYFSRAEGLFKSDLPTTPAAREVTLLRPQCRDLSQSSTGQLSSGMERTILAQAGVRGPKKDKPRAL